MKWDWSYVYEELAAAFAGKPAPGVFFEVSNDGVRIDECRVYLRVPGLNGGYTYRILSVYGMSDTGYVRIRLDENIALEIGWPTDLRISFVTDREELHDLCVAVSRSLALAGLIYKLDAEVNGLERRICGLLDDVGADTGELNIRIVRAFLNKNCLEVTSE